MPGYPLTYYPGSPAPADAQLVEVDVGTDVQGADVRISAGRTAHISGVAFDAGSRPWKGELILAHSQRSGGLSAPPRLLAVQADGTFTIASVGPGEYVLQTRTFMGSEDAQFASAFVAVGDQDVKDVTLAAV